MRTNPGTPMPRRLRRHAAAGLVLALMTLGGCLGGKTVAPNRVVPTPPTRLVETEETHLLEVTAPGQGWSLRFDRSELARDSTRLLYTLRRPDPTLFVPNKEVTLRAISDTPSGVGVTVLVRVLDHGASGSSGRYARPSGLEG